MLEPYTKDGECKNCGCRTSWILHRQFGQGGAETFCWKCSRCNVGNPNRSPNYWISKTVILCHLSEAQIEKLPVIMPDASNRCVKCGTRTAELHHWAPKAIFGLNEAEQWPKDYLCKPCHDEWHKKVTPQLVKP